MQLSVHPNNVHFNKLNRMNFSKHLIRLLAAGLFLLTGVVFVACNNNETPTAQPRTITDIVQSDSRFTILRAAVSKAGLADALRAGSLTVFAPTDAAFQASNITLDMVNNTLTAAQLTPILQYHVLNSRVPSANIPVAVNTAQATLLATNGTVYITKTSSGSVSVNGKNVTTADVAADNGVIHIIDGVLMPPTGDVVATVSTNPASYSLLVAAVTRAGTPIQSALQSTTAATILAPTNEAFIAAGLSATAIQNADPATLQRVLAYHVIPGRVFSTQVPNGAVTTLLGATPTLTAATSSTGVTFTGAGNANVPARVVEANILTTNAVIHRIDRVLLPGS